MLLHSIGLDHCQCPLPGEEKVDLPLGLLRAVAAVQLVVGLVLHSELGSQTGRAQTLESAITGAADFFFHVFFKKKQNNSTADFYFRGHPNTKFSKNASDSTL